MYSEKLEILEEILGTFYSSNDEILFFCPFCKHHKRKLSINLSKNNYTSYEISNFCKTGMECKHNLHYWNLDKYLAFGPSAHGFNGEARWWNVRSLDEYFKKINQDESPVENFEILTNKDHFNELIFNGLRMVEGIPTEKQTELFSGDINNYLNAKLAKWDGLELSKDTIFLNERGIMLADEIASDLFID